MKTPWDARTKEVGASIGSSCCDAFSNVELAMQMMESRKKFTFVGASVDVNNHVNPNFGFGKGLKVTPNFGFGKD